MELVSVIMPAYNAEKYIAESIESVIAQTYTNWELIVVDDGSMDNTSGIVKALSAIDSRIKYIYQPNQQMGKARNTGLQNCNGTLVAFLDSDDIWVSDKLEIQVACIINRQVDLVFSNGYVFSESVDQVEYEYKTLCGEISGKLAQRELMRHNFIPIPSVLAFKSAIAEVGGFNEEISIHNVADYQLWLKLLLGGFRFFGLEDKLFFYRKHNSQSTHSDPYSFEAVLNMYENHLKAPASMKKEVRRAKLLWAGNWFKLNGINKESAKVLLKKMNQYPFLKFYVAFIRVSLFFFGVKYSRKAVNRASLFLSKS